MTYPDIVRKELLDSINKSIQENDWDFKEFPRRRKLSANDVIWILLSMSGGSLKKVLYELGIDVTASAFVQRRRQVSSLLFEDAWKCFNSAYIDDKTFYGYRVLAVDGTTVNIARNPKDRTFVCNASNPRGYNQLHVTPLFDVLNKTYCDCVIQPQPQADETGALTFMLAWNDFPTKTLIVGDRGFEGYNNFCHLLNTPNADFLMRI